MSKGEPQREGWRAAAPSREGEPAAEAPLLRVISGHPTAEELAALLAVVATCAAPAADETGPPTVSAWRAPIALVRPVFRPAPGAWTTSGWQPGVRTRASF